jgi:hypothetical protein
MKAKVVIGIVFIIVLTFMASEFHKTITSYFELVAYNIQESKNNVGIKGEKNDKFEVDFKKYNFGDNNKNKYSMQCCFPLT